MKKLLPIIFIFFLSGCAAFPIIPAAMADIFGYAKAGVDVVSYAATDKSTTDHLISAIEHEDCALHRALKEEEICIKPENDINK